jgi:sugar lactone lactonase YvrE
MWFGPSIAVGPDGTLYVADAGHGRICGIAPDGTVTTLAGGRDQDADGIPATQARLFAPTGLALGPDGSLVFADRIDQRVRRVRSDATIETLVGSGASAYVGDGGAARSASVGTPEAVAFGPDGSLYIADQDNHRVRKIWGPFAN